MTTRLCRVLGPVGVVVDGRAVDLGGPQRAALLAVLLAAHGRTVSDDALVDALWPEDPPTTALGSLRAHVSRLRGALTAAADRDEVVVVREAGGYRIAGGTVATDAELFEQETARAARLARDGQAAAALPVLDAALERWRGEAYAWAPAVPAVLAERRRLDELRRAAELERFDVLLALGAHGDAVAGLQAFVTSSPQLERGWELLALALYRSGRQADALAALRDARRVLLEEHGLDPGPALRRLEAAVLDQDPALEPAQAPEPAQQPAPPPAEAAAPGTAPGTAPTPPTSPTAGQAPRPPAAARPRATGGLASPGTPLWGRERDVAAVGALLRRADARIVTLTGIGGVGKTRLALAAASAVEAELDGGVTVVPLAALTDPAFVFPTVAHALGLDHVEEARAFEAVVESLQAAPALLVLDNLEQLLGIAPQVAELVAQCPRLTVLATSRAPLRVRGEVEHPVVPLVLPSEHAATVEEVAASGAGALFADRAAAVVPSFRLTPANAPAVAALCHRLAGIPLALELAAARVRLLPPEALLDRLAEAMARDGSRDLPARQRTMRATLDWSYGLLPQPEQQLLRSLSVFSGGFSLAAVEVVAEGAGLARTEVLALLESLVEHSLVVVDTWGSGTPGFDEPRFLLLEPVVEYAASLLVGEERERVAAAHAAYFLDLARRAAPEYEGEHQVEWLCRIERDDANLRAAMAWCLESDPLTAARMGWALWLYWWLRGRLLLGRRSMEHVLRHDLPTAARVGALIASACMGFAQADLPHAEKRWSEAAELAAREGDSLMLANSIAGIGLVALARRDLATAEARFLHALPLATAAGPVGAWLRTLTLIWLGTVLLARGETTAALARMRSGLEEAERRGDRLAAYIALFNLSQAAIVTGDPAAARDHLLRGIRLSLQTGDLANLAYFLEELAVVEGGIGQAHRVAVLVGAAEALRESVGSAVYGYYLPDEALRQATADRARAELGDERYEDTVRAGRALGPHDAAAFALAYDVPAVGSRDSGGG
ncbi:AfsR/SARP family transcriptional regulator [Motilibacter deserti]|uniref:AfsR/SARP family transcriptional regulator n=1 Tax=Motilibacter deserti TaxID=2714956 RepID=A0ABX0GWV2_9ACTN|nr:BTAD domain-containing putative transcriptional regulator [Motilibacter deserti]NHC15055.1 AfsR/SARP family transcriptional regulator [Motilibacter deserti]